MSPQGRLTLQSGKPIMDSSDITASTLYYTPYIGNTLPVWDGSKFVDQEFIEMALSLYGALAGKLYDIFFDGSALIIGTAWSSNAARASGISMIKGVWCDSTHCVYLGTVYIAASGQVKFQLKPAPAAYGTANELGVWNAYNRVRVRAVCRDLNTEWQYFSSMPRYADNSDRFRIYWIDGLAQSTVEVHYRASVAGVNNNPTAATVGAVLDCSSTPSLGDGELAQSALNNGALGMEIEGKNSTVPLLGRHYYQAVEQTTDVAIGFFGNDFASLSVELEM